MRYGCDQPRGPALSQLNKPFLRSFTGQQQSQVLCVLMCVCVCVGLVWQLTHQYQPSKMPLQPIIPHRRVFKNDNPYAYLATPVVYWFLIVTSNLGYQQYTKLHLKMHAYQPHEIIAMFTNDIMNNCECNFLQQEHH